MDWQDTYTQMYEPLRGFILKRLGPKHQSWADDLLHDIFIKLHAKIQDLRDETKLIPWMYGITRNAVYDFFRKQSFDMEEVEGLGIMEEEPENYTAEFATCILPMIDSLPDPYREALWLTEVKGLSQKELAAHSAISYSGAKSRVQRGREKLRDTLEACCQISTDCYGNVIAYEKK